VLLGAVLLGAVLLGAFPALAGASPATPPGLPVGQRFDGLPTVGALFPAEDGPHLCTATVVHSLRRDLLLTAAHCVVGTGAGLRFVPMLARGVAPYGTWTVAAVHADPRWITDGDPRADYAFLTVASRDEGGGSVRVEDVVGAQPLALAAYPRRAVVVGYPAGSDDRPITCTARTYTHQGFPAFDCDGYTEGTSGGPWLTPHGAVFGLTGGLHQGGCVPWTSYSPRLGAGVAVTYARAALGLPGDVLPEPPADGC
jgi:hypothetical protein